MHFVQIVERSLLWILETVPRYCSGFWIYKTHTCILLDKMKLDVKKLDEVG